MLSIQNLRKTFHPTTPNEVRALRGVDLKIEEGAFVVVIGTNGSGKSTLLNAVAGVFLPDTGRIELAGADVTRWPEHRRASLIGRVFQNPFTGTSPHMTIAENLALAARRGRFRGLGWALSKRFSAEVRERVKELNMGLEDRLNNEIGNLSGGQRTISRWFDLSAFAIPAQYTYGNSGRNTLYGPPSNNLDLKIGKNFYFWEKKRLEFRCEMFNSSNTPRFSLPASNVNLPTAGIISGAGAPRQIQFGLKFVY